MSGAKLYSHGKGRPSSDLETASLLVAFVVASKTKKKHKPKYVIITTQKKIKLPYFRKQTQRRFGNSELINHDKSGAT